MRRTFALLASVTALALSSFALVQSSPSHPNSDAQMATISICEGNSCSDQGWNNSYALSSDSNNYPEGSDMTNGDIFSVVFLTVLGLVILAFVTFIIWGVIGDNRDRKKHERWVKTETRAATKDLENYGYTLQGDDEIDIEDNSLWLDCGVGGVELQLYKIDGRWQVFRDWSNGERFLVPFKAFEKLREEALGASHDFDRQLGPTA